MKTTDALVESEQFQDFLYAMQRGEDIAPCPYCGWSCVVKTIAESPEPLSPIAKLVNCENCKRSTSFELEYPDTDSAVTS